MITFRNVTKQFSTQVVLSDATFQINPGERVGVVGPNGAGKTTLFELIVGESSPDKGSISVPQNGKLGYLRQYVPPATGDTSLLEFAEDALPAFREIQAEIETLEHTFQAQPEADRKPLLRRLGELQTRFEALGGYQIRNRAEVALCGLGFPVPALHEPFRTFSGGWQMRAELARVLASVPEILLLDEPSNYLDIPAVEWLQKFLREYSGTLIMISHDRYLLNSLTSVTIEVAHGRAERYEGNYDSYVRQREVRYQQRLAAQKNQDRQREKLETFIERFKAKNTKAQQAQSKMKMLARLESIDVPKIIQSPGRIRLRPPPHCGVEVVRMENAGLTYDGDRWVLRGVDLRLTRGEKIALVGYNGMGKTTLLRMLAGRLPLSEGKRIISHNVIVGYQSQDFAETMDSTRSVYETVKSVAADVSDQETRNLLGGFGFSGDAIDKTVGVLSGGEKIRVAFARLLIKPPNFLVLDEPTTHLDIQARERLEEALQSFQGTMCLVSHDIDFVRKVATGIVAMTPPGITRYPGGYDYYHEKVNSVQVSGFSAQKPGSESALKPETRNLAPEPEAEAGGSKVDKKELRRQRAQAREALYDKTKDLRLAIRKSEAEVARLETEKAALTQELASPNEKTNFASISRRLQQVQYEIDIATTKWEEATVALEKVMGTEEPPRE